MNVSLKYLIYSFMDRVFLILLIHMFCHVCKSEFNMICPDNNFDHFGNFLKRDERWFGNDNYARDVMID